jgi:hypothetical protein
MYITTSHYSFSDTYHTVIIQAWLGRRSFCRKTTWRWGTIILPILTLTPSLSFGFRYWNKVWQWAMSTRWRRNWKTRGADAIQCEATVLLKASENFFRRGGHESGNKEYFCGRRCRKLSLTTSKDDLLWAHSDDKGRGTMFLRPLG